MSGAASRARKHACWAEKLSGKPRGLQQAQAASLCKVGQSGLADEHGPRVQAVFSPHRPPLLDAHIQGTSQVTKRGGPESNTLWEEGEARLVTDWVFKSIGTQRTLKEAFILVGPRVKVQLGDSELNRREI